MGRPPSEKPKKITISVRCTQKEFEQVQKLALGETPGSWLLRKGLEPPSQAAQDHAAYCGSPFKELTTEEAIKKAMSTPAVQRRQHHLRCTCLMCKPPKGA